MNMELFSILNWGSFAGGNLELFQKLHHRITADPSSPTQKRAEACANETNDALLPPCYVAVRQCGLLVCNPRVNRPNKPTRNWLVFGAGLFMRRASSSYGRTYSTVVRSNDWIREGERRNPRICYAIFEESRQSTAPHRTRDEPDWPLLDIEVGKS
jgi:hypothetical protein